MIPESNCIHCKTLLFDKNPPLMPKCGDFAICIYCGGINRFNKNLKLSKVKEKDISYELKMKSALIKISIKLNISIEQFIKDELIKSGHIKSH